MTNFERTNRTRKTTYHITGNLALPIRIGERAWITASGQSLMTSTVKRILEVSYSGVIFETQNSIYNLGYATVPNEAEVMCA